MTWLEKQRIARDGGGGKQAMQGHFKDFQNRDATNGLGFQYYLYLPLRKIKRNKHRSRSQDKVSVGDTDFSYSGSVNRIK